MQRVSGREATALEEMQEDIMRPFTKILNEITQHKWAWPFKEPVDVEGLQLHDYYEIIEKPMDFSTIKRKMEAKDGSGYKNVREIYADVRLIFKNAMRYNDEKNDIHVMAKTLLEKFEKKWLLLLPKIAKAESELSKEEAHEQLDKKLAKEATYGSMTRDLSTELSKVDMDLKNLKAVVTGQCRKLSRPEKFILVKGIPKLSPDNLLHALKIINESDPNFKHSTQMVTLDLDSQSDYTVWRLHMYVKKTLEVQATTEGITVTTHEESIEDKKNNSKRRRIG
ncbi:transcription factor GTE1-like isoform X2 [Cicer arietinum]|nr:transcription factor GTE1-like isoform X2 [Cicer arietinum]